MLYTEQAIVAGRQGITASLPPGCFGAILKQLPGYWAFFADNIKFLVFPRGGARKAGETDAFKLELLEVTSKQSRPCQLAS